MLYNLLFPLADEIGIFNLFRYITLRTGGAVVTSLFVSFVLGPAVIRWLKSKQADGQPIREDGPQSHLITKKGTPTMGGLMILIGITVSTILWADLENLYIWIVLFVCTSLGLLGFLDDYLKIKFKNSSGINAKLKFLGQLIISLISILALVYFTDHETISNLYFPFFKNLILQMGLFFIPFSVFVIIGSSNAVNLTDGLDGLATVPVMLVALSFSLICYLVGNSIFANYLQIQYIPNVGELSIFCGSIVGSCLGFLWYNAPPAKIFMGDTGSLSLGGSIAAVAIIVKHEIVLAIIGDYLFWRQCQ